MQQNRLIIVDGHDHREELAIRTKREHRIEALSIDRSRFVGGTYHWGPEAEAAEAPLRQLRAEATLDAKAAAWRGLFSLKEPRNHRRR